MTKFVELKSSLPSTEGKKVPSANALKLSGEIFLIQENDGVSITVYTNGFFAYKAGKYNTVWGVDRIKYLIYGDTKIQMCDFENLEWYWPLVSIGEYRIEQNQEVERAKHEVFLDAEDIDVLYSKGIDDEEENEDRSAEIEQALSVLTPQQKIIFTTLVTNPKSTYQSVANELNISHQQVTRQFFAACKRLGVDHTKVR